MRWQIAHFIFCDQQQSLTDNKHTQQLEPMTVELLRYFCQHPDVIISKDELITNVWLGRIVSDNAVSKLITKLRKAFVDDVRRPQFIATFPKKGYKFIASVKLLDEQNKDYEACTEHLQPTSNDTEPSVTPEITAFIKQLAHEQNETTVATIGNHRVKSTRKIIIGICMLIFIMVAFSWQQTKNQQITTSAKALTTDAGDEFFAEYSPDGTRVAYLSKIRGNVYLRIKRIADETVITIDDHGGMGVGPASWNDEGTKLAYLVGNSSQCQYFIREIDGLTLGKSTLIHNCTAGSFGKILFTHDDNLLVYAENNGAGTPYTLFSIDLKTGKQKRLAQPDIYLGGNYQFDLHPSKNTLLISSPDQQQWEGFYQLDLDTDKLTLLFKLNAYVCCAIWSHDGEHVVMMGEHPANDLLRYDVKGKKVAVIYAGTRVIRAPKRHSNGRDYLFSAGDRNTDLARLSLNTQRQSVIANSSVNERFARVANTSDTIAYISLATGHEEVWLTSLDNQSRSKLTQFDDDRHYVDLRWSPNDEYLMALTLNEIHLISVKDGRYKRLKITQNEIKGVSFKSENIIAYSVKVAERWQVHFYNLQTNSVSKAESKWQFVHFRANEKDTLWLDQQQQLFVGKTEQQQVTHLKLSSYFLDGRQFNLRKQGEQWYWFDYQMRKILSFTDGQKESDAKPLVSSRVSDFDITTSHLLYGQVKQENLDIYQTSPVTK
ncbi:winged helix-turn-helix domain-containing protein [Thalassotalea sp. 1_MG-2023]|uniref:winged helix-turn-helix domain-containing protein n=1 Tax=Thalassotalea sp. 1_MG-2023 TaxID=3062680 RepID=UPI0026E2F42A|nr:winged helix-turn-helix domain-containing protein [Thalassotalea sp. 1_MG-2023]MDO6426080.1 winged helix-turn-helix domain-containing protein [Thalassotalea sp. 1_MG-2023]